MSSKHNSLDAAAADRKARLAKLAGLKRKQPDADTTIPETAPSEQSPAQELLEDRSSKTDIYISGRNYDKDLKAPKLGFENAPDASEHTVERHAERLAKAAADQAAIDEAKADKGIDLFSLQPKKPNWDLKRELAEKMRVLDVRTQNAVAKLVRQRIEEQKRRALQGDRKVDDTGEEVGLDGNVLVEGVHLREREEEEEKQRLQELDDIENAYT